MKKIITFTALFVFAFFAIAQDHSAESRTVRKVNDKGTKGIECQYFFPNLKNYNVSEGSTAFTRIGLKDFTFLKTIGKPALPAHYDLVLLPEGAKTKIVLKSSKSAQQSDLLIYPALRHATDRYGDPEPEFTIDSAFYNSNQWYPEKPVTIVKEIKIKGISLAVVQICPVQYNPKLRKVRAFGNLNYEIKFSGSKKFITHKEQYSAAFLKQLNNCIINSGAVLNEINAWEKSSVAGLPVKTSSSKNYIIITHSDYREAADSLAKWKSQLGYSVEVISRSLWTSAQVKSEIQSRYHAWTPKPDYFVILGDHDKVPGEIFQDPAYYENFASDLYYACMDGPGDYVADMAFGRISVSSASQAIAVVNKIIGYEKNPPASTAFYSSGTVCSYFQDNEPKDTYEDRRFVMTMEEIRNYMLPQGFTIDRIYKASETVDPLYYNNGYFANSEPLPSELLKPGFAWDGDKNDIAAALNSSGGRLFLAHRDHGYVGGSGWATPEFTSNDIDMLNNGDKLPVVFSINCHTGEYRLTECFAEKFLRKANGGAVGVFGAAYYSYSGFNDGLIDGMFDAIWASPGLIPDFTGYADEPVGTPESHEPIFTMGDVLNQGLLRMVQTWGDDEYTHQLFHYFGDPAMKIWTAFPSAITATHQDTLECLATSFMVISSSCPDGLATLVVDGVLMAADTLNNGSVTLTFPPVAGELAVLTISKHNYRPYIANIPFSSPCVRAHFTIDYSYSCAGEPITFTDASTGDNLSYSWHFGSGAEPQSSLTEGPHQVLYSNPGMKIISLTVSNGTDSSSYTDSVYISQPCVFTCIQNQVVTINSCEGVLIDNGGYNNYLPNSNDTIKIIADGAENLNLYFAVFDVEQGDSGYCNYDYLKIYDGADTTATLLGKFCSLPANIPPSIITSSGNTVLLIFHSDGYTEGQGYEINFNCNITGQKPSAAFTAEPLSSCDGLIHFSNLSTNSPASFFWDFGDGDTSDTENPSHQFMGNGNYTISLIATNTYGSDTMTRINYIYIQRPQTPAITNDTLCGPAQATLEASSEGVIRWYDGAIAENLLYTGNTFITPLLDTTTTYYAESATNEVFSGGAPDTLIGDGGYYTSSNAHYTRFDCLSDILLVSVDVYAQTTGTRTIKLQEHSGNTIYDTAINLNAGKTTIYLNWTIAAASNYRLVADGPEFKLYRNLTGAQYPYSIGNVLNITGNSYGNPAYYYYFYNWKIQAGECISPRIAVTAFVHIGLPHPGFTYYAPDNTVAFTNTSTNAVSYSWDFNDGNFSEEENPVHTYMENGNYYVSLTAGNACGDSTLTDTITITCVGINETNDIQNISVTPNPATGNIFLNWSGKAEKNIKIEITDITGRQVFSKELLSAQGNNSCKIDLQNLTGGIYFVNLKKEEKAYVSKLIIF
ncbi:MAG: C25 family cysteine peptidase [Bacteroidales bacterium]|jgi:PKD repeat protein|nr:C25 family cysteine peptidase [Bacteroidales bacterium]